MRVLLIAALASLATASGARAQDIAQLPLGSEVQTFVAAPDGGAWVEIRRSERHANGSRA